MTEKDEQQKRVRSILCEAVTLLCRSGLSYNSGFTVEGLLGITVDNADVFLVNIRETVSTTLLAPPPLMSVMSETSTLKYSVGPSSAVSQVGYGGDPKEYIEVKQVLGS